MTWIFQVMNGSFHMWQASNQWNANEQAWLSDASPWGRTSKDRRKIDSLKRKPISSREAVYSVPAVSMHLLTPPIFAVINKSMWARQCRAMQTTPVLKSLGPTDDALPSALTRHIPRTEHDSLKRKAELWRGYWSWLTIARRKRKSRNTLYR